MPEASVGRVLGVLLASFVAAGAGAADTERRAAGDFHRRAVVDADDLTPGAAYSIPLSDEAVSALSRRREARLFDASGAEIPYSRGRTEPHVDVVDHPVTVFNRAWDAAGGQTFSVEIPDPRPEWIDQFVIGIGGGDYHVRVRVEGSDDGEAWRILADRRHLLRYSAREQEISYVHDVVTIPRSRFRYYRFALARRDPGSGTEPLETERVRVREAVWRDTPREVGVALASLDDPRDQDTRHDYWRLDLGHEGLGVNRVSLEIPTEEFARSGSLWEWSDERDRRTRRLASTVVFQYGDDSHTHLDGFATDARVLALMIDQGDDEPVRVEAARARRPDRQLRFLAPRALRLPLALYFEPDAAREPRYDLDRRLRENGIDRFTELTHAALERNPAYREPKRARSEELPYLLYALVVPLVLGLGWYVARTIRRGLPDDTPPADS